MEIITGVERRRLENKLRILAELKEPGVKFVDVARRHDVSRSLLWQWRDAQRWGKLEVEDASAIIPFHVVPALPGPRSSPLADNCRSCSSTSKNPGCRTIAIPRAIPRQ